LHINTERTLGAGSKAIKQSMNRFELAILNKHNKHHGQKIVPNITRMQAALIKKVKKNETFKIISAGKNYGFTLIESEHLKERGVSEHLNNEDVYQRISKQPT